MNRKRRLWVIIDAGIVITVVVGLIAFRLTLVCCALPPTPPTLTAQSIINGSNQALLLELVDTQTATALRTSTRTPLPYDPTLYAQRRHEEQVLETGAGPTQYAIFFATETALVATYQGTTIPAQKTMTAIAGITSTYAISDMMTQAVLSGSTFVPTPTPLDYTADMSPTAIPRISTVTATPTLCPPSDVICPGGNATMSAADKVMVLMASASAPEFGQLAQTATALAVTPIPSPTITATLSVHDSNCAFSWAHQDLPDIAQAAREALSTISMASIQVLRADAYGENCNRADGSLSSFAAMTTDFYLSVNVSDLTDSNYLGQVVVTAYSILKELKVKLPAQAGYLDIVFTAGGTSKDFRAMFPTIKHAIETGKRGAELLAVGGLS